MLTELGQANPVPVPGGMTADKSQPGEVSPATLAAMAPSLQLTPALLQLLGSMGQPGQQSAMDGSLTGSLPINPQTFDLANLPAGIQPQETLVTANQLLALNSPKSIDPQLAMLMEQPTSTVTMPTISELTADAQQTDVAPYRLPVDLMMTKNDLAKLQMLLAGLQVTPQGQTAEEPVTVNGVPIPVDTSSPSYQPELQNLEQMLKSQFPTLNIEHLSAQLNLKDPQLAQLKAALAATAKETPVGSTPAKPQLVIAQSGDPIVKQAPTQNPSQIATPVDIAAAQKSEILSVAGTVASQVQAAIDPANPAATATQPVVETVNQKATPESTSPLSGATQTQSGNLVKTAVKSAESADSGSSYSQTAQNWSGQASDRSDVASTEQVAQPREPHVDKTKFKIQFDRFQIDALLKRSEIKLQLQPASLGNMRVKLVATPQEMTARFETTNEAARIAVEQNLPQLKESLERAGIKVDHVEVVLDEQRMRQQQEQHQSQRKHRPDTQVAENSGAESEQTSGGMMSSVGRTVLGGLNLLA